MKNQKDVPQIILKAKCINHPIDYKWNNKKMQKFVDPFVGNEQLENILSKINHKAAVGLTAALLEWVHWRFRKYATTANDVEKRIEALWCLIDNPEYTMPLDFDIDLDMPAKGSVDGPMWTALMTVKMVDVRYRKGSYFLQSEIIGLVLLARHLCPKRKVFEKWFDKTIKELTLSFPCPYSTENLDESDEAVYDSSTETPISRDFFFDPKFKYSPESSEKALNNFINNLDYKTNPFLCIQKNAS
ncbi:hypothetical protein [Flavobacterium aquidurense]|uniref:hypothetical protein n=1 Tax=Flavobacterium aquidurense TaxID=362413 RepID=UPI0028597FCE|nr:hypothetical protein [Flavobacterium aquidurense]MDR7371831.1 hypothetical protein [Flavobacterium aquidurense]